METATPSSVPPSPNETSVQELADFARERDIFGIVVSMAVLVYILASIGFSRYIIRYGPKK
jgi:hypothetical protein